MPTYTVHECTDLPTFRTLIPVLWTANHHPYQPYFSAYNPVFGPTATDREAAIERSCQLYWSNHLACPESHWIYARNEEDGSVTGVTRWDLYEESPFGRFEAKGDGTAQQQSPADIWPEGSVGREFVAVMRRRQYAHRRRWLDRRHAGR